MNKILYELNSKEELEQLISQAVKNALSKSSEQTKTIQKDELLTSEELCSWMKISRTQEWILCKKGIISFIRIGNTKRFIKSEVLKKLKSFQNG